MNVPFLGQAYQSRSPVLSSQTAINIFPELTEKNSDAIGAFYGTPGLITKYTGSGEVRGLREVPGPYLFGVIGNTVYRWDMNWSATNLGTLPNSTGRVSIIHNETQVAIAHGSGWHWVLQSGSVIAPVTNSPNSSILTYQDQYGLYTDVNGLFGITALADLSTLDPLDVADAEAQPDNLNSIASNHDEVWLFGDDTTEIWDNTGAALFPFQKISGGVIEQGCCAKFSPAKLDNSIFWLGRDRAGRGIVYRSNGYAPVRISTHPIEFAINSYSTISDAIGFGYQEEGHSFYCLTFPTGDATWVYDVATQGWHQRAWMDSSGLLHRHRANCYATFMGKHIVGDWQNGKVYQMDLGTYLDDSAVIYRERAFDLPDSEQNRVRVDKFEVFATIGDGSTPTNGAMVQLWLQVSRDAGRNFGYQRIISTGAVGATKARARWRRLGYGRDLVLRVATTMANRVHWVSALMDAEKLSQ